LTHQITIQSRKDKSKQNLKRTTLFSNKTNRKGNQWLEGFI